MKRKLIYLVSTLLFVSGCAKKAEDIPAAYISPLQYQNYECSQLQFEMERVAAKVNEIAQIQNKEHKKDVAATTVGLIIFWPALFFLAGSDRAEELSRLKGEYEALQKAAVSKKCTFIKEKDANETISGSL